MKLKLLILSAVPAVLLPAAACTSIKNNVQQQPAIVLRKQQPEKTKPLVYLYATGEGLANSSKESGEAAIKEVEEILRTEPSLKNLATIRFRRPFRLKGDSITGADWLRLARSIQKTLDKPDVSGVVITHDSNSLEDTAYFLNLLIKSQKPVVLVSTIPPVKTVTAENVLNFYNALAAAASPESRDMGVLVSMNDTLYAARDVSKSRAAKPADMFRSGDFGPLGYIINGKPQYYYKTTKRHTAHTEFNLADIKELPRVEIMFLYAGATRELIEKWIREGVKGIVIDCSGEGALTPEIKDSLKQAIKAGIVVVRASRTDGASVTCFHNIDAETDRNTVTGNSLTPQKAKILLMLALTKTGAPHEVQKFFDRY